MNSVGPCGWIAILSKQGYRENNCVTYNIFIEHVLCTYYVHMSELGRCPGGEKSESCLVCKLKGVEVLTVRQKGSHTYQITAEGHDWDPWAKLGRRSEYKITQLPGSIRNCHIMMQTYPRNQAYVRVLPAKSGSGRAGGDSSRGALFILPSLH